MRSRLLALYQDLEYDLGDSLRLSDLIIKADSILGDAYLDRVDIVRTKPDFTEELIKLDLKKALQKDPQNDIYLEGYDRIKVYGMTEMVPKTYVSISGHVKTPGKYLLQENMTLYDLIFKAGGYVDQEFKKLTFLERAELVRVKKDSDEKELIPFNLGKVLTQKDSSSVLLRADDAVRIYSLKEVKGEKRHVTILGVKLKDLGNMSFFKIICRFMIYYLKPVDLMIQYSKQEFI